MKRVFGVKKDKEPPPSIEDASDRINKRGDTVDEKLKKLDAELSRYKEQIKKTRPGPAQEAIKARAMRVLKQKRMYEGQRDMLYNQTFNLDQVSFAAEGLKDAQQTWFYSKTFVFLGSAQRGTVQDYSGEAFSVPLLESAAYLMRGYGCL
ncbi:Snf7 family - like 4 [Theobroma cacao]|nr:Snf7 family - like 4 [Theobroma cacao]